MTVFTPAGRTAFVTGGASGIGLGIAEALLEAGARVVIADINADAVAEAASGLGSPETAAGLQLDVRDRNQWRSAKEDAERRFGPVTILVNNAGVIGYDPIIDTPPESFDWVLSVNVTGVFNGIHTFGRAIVDGGSGGYICNTSSISGLYGSLNLTLGSYIASKYAVIGLTEQLRSELADTDVGVSVLCPGPVASGLGANAALLRPVPAHARPEALSLPDVPKALDASTLGRFVVRCMTENRTYIIPQVHFAELVEARHQGLMADFRDAADPDLPIAPHWRDLA